MRDRKTEAIIIAQASRVKKNRVKIPVAPSLNIKKTEAIIIAQASERKKSGVSPAKHLVFAGLPPLISLFN